MLFMTLRKIKPMQKTIQIISNGVGLFQLSWVRRERGVAFLALIPYHPHHSGAMVSAGRARGQLEGPPSVCQALFQRGNRLHFPLSRKQCQALPLPLSLKVILFVGW